MPKSTEADLSILDPELEILQNIYAQPGHVRQRDLARIAGLSLGMTNSILKRLVQKGWLMIRKVNNRNIRYVVSAVGIDQITRRSYQFFKRTIKNIVYYREALEHFVRDIKERGYGSLILVGKSDLDFIIEHACVAFGVEYILDEGKAEAAGRIDNGLFILYSESYVPDDEEKSIRPAVAFVQEVVGGLGELMANQEWIHKAKTTKA